jgi:hypothetical protein
MCGNDHAATISVLRGNATASTIAAVAVTA